MSKRDVSRQLLISQFIIHDSRRGAHMAYVGEFKRRGWVDGHGEVTDLGREVLKEVKPEEAREYPAETPEYPPKREPEHEYWNEVDGLAFSISFLAGAGIVLLICALLFWQG